jgi:HAMP domain-containing protein
MSATAILAICLAVPVLCAALLLLLIWLLGANRYRAVRDLERAIERGDIEAARAILLARGDLLDLDTYEVIERWIRTETEGKVFVEDEDR